MPVGGSEPTVNTTGGGRGGCQWVVVNPTVNTRGGGRGGCQRVVSDHHQSTTPTWWR